MRMAPGQKLTWLWPPSLNVMGPEEQESLCAGPLSWGLQLAGQGVAAGQRGTCESLEPHVRGPSPRACQQVEPTRDSCPASPLLLIQGLHGLKEGPEVLLGFQVMHLGHVLVCHDLTYDGTFLGQRKDRMWTRRGVRSGAVGWSRNFAHVETHLPSNAIQPCLFPLLGL